MKQTKNTRVVWFLAGKEAVAYSLAGGKAAAVTRESGEIAACSLAREERRRQSLVVVLGQRANSKTIAKCFNRQKQLPSAGLDARGVRPENHVSTKAAAVTRESGEIAACSLAREERRRQSLALGLGVSKLQNDC